MMEHFNEKYLESELYPKSTFNGKLVGFQEGVTGEQKVHAVGKFFIHGVENEIDVPGTVELISGKVIMKSTFQVKLADYKIKIPEVMWQKIAEEVQVKLDFTYKAL